MGLDTALLCSLSWDDEKVVRACAAEERPSLRNRPWEAEWLLAELELGRTVADGMSVAGTLGKCTNADDVAYILQPFLKRVFAHSADSTREHPLPFGLACDDELVEGLAAPDWHCDADKFQMFFCWEKEEQLADVVARHLPRGEAAACAPVIAWLRRLAQEPRENPNGVSTFAWSGTAVDALEVVRLLVPFFGDALEEGSAAIIVYQPEGDLAKACNIGRPWDSDAVVVRHHALPFGIRWVPGELRR